MVLQQFFLILDNIRSAHNVGSIFRTAECAGVTNIILCGYTPCPIDRFGRKRSDISKIALGAEEHVSWKYSETTEGAIRMVKDENVVVIALEQDPHAVDYRSFMVSTKIALIVGNEVDGISREILGLADHIIYIPLHGVKESLNVSVATGIALFQLAE